MIGSKKTELNCWSSWPAEKAGKMRKSVSDTQDGKMPSKNKNNSSIRRRKQDEPNSVERGRKLGATSKADAVKVPLRYS